MQPRMGGLIQVNIADRATLQASYMPYIQVALWAVNVNTRRESGGHIRYREVFDRS